MSEIKLAAKKRVALGSNANKKVRKEKYIPAVIYQRGEENVEIKVVDKEFDKVFGEAGTSAIITIDLEGTSRKVIVKDYQRHPIKNMYLHIDFQGVKMDELIKVTVPVVLVGRDEIRVQPSVLMQNISEVEVECLPGDIPAQAEINVEEMQYNDTFLVKDLDIFSNEKINVLVDGEDVVCSLIEPKEENLEVEEEEKSAADVEEIGKPAEEE